jgi:hypothetical protein
VKPPRNTAKLHTPKRQCGHLRGPQLKIVLGICGVAILVLLAVRATQPDWRVENDGSRLPEGSVRFAAKDAAATLPLVASAPFQYFPSEYRNSAQNGAPEQHIQAY